ncbi:hypothetical protein BS47DRAFT_1402036 [Hydnum rufescens UP504]|uniref:Uncharacterized protein n=1 Tax=Hydnum rufescens UP504 TaxID=1448309 RepID=A0A9P6DHA9_9AGAM|nr:hypothetical protein BS47DRAFT_1402036 [Hydnum rufescens UP504]
MAKIASLRTGSRRIKGAHSAPTSTVSGSRNASGYQKRLERKNKRPPTNDPDVYEYSATRDRRANITLDIDKDELRGLGQDTLDGDAANKAMEMLRQKITADMGEDMGVVDSEDDEDIDSDAAFEGESDEERFGAFKFAQKPGPSQRPKSPKKSTGMSLSALLDRDVLAPSDDEDIELEGDALNKLDSFIDDLSYRKRKASDITDPLPARSIKRRVIPERTEAAIEGEFAVPSGTHAGSSLIESILLLPDSCAINPGKITLDDLLKPSSASGNNASLASLEKSAKLLSSTKNQPLSVPLHQRQQDRVDREAAYEATKEEVQKWAPTMKRIKEAEHLSFPLQAPAVLNTSSSELTSKFKPSTELESAVDRLLKASKLREEDIEKTEELQMSNLTIEEVAARRAELRQMRELMFRAEAKAKRVLDPEAADAERLKLEAARAKERANPAAQEYRQLNAQLERGEQLRRKIQGLNEDNEAPEDFVESDGENDVAGVAARAFDELAGLDSTDQQVRRTAKTKSGLLEMKFMRDAEERGYRVAESMADDFRAELLAVQGNQGRLIFRPTADQSQNAGPSRVTPVRLTKSNESDTSSVTLKSSVESVTASPQLDLRPPSQPSQHIPPNRESLAGEPYHPLSRNNLLALRMPFLVEADDAVVEISLDKAMTIDHAKQKRKQKSKQEGKETTEMVIPVIDPTFRNSDDEGDDAREEGVKAFEQRDLVALAFAGDNVVEEFTARKQREIEADAPTTIDMTLPGWGSWGGRGTKKSQPKPHLIKKRKDKKAGRYMVKDLPHPYTTKAQFELSLEMPIGSEWNTRMGFQKSTLPKVIKKMGTVINPIEKLF